MNVLLAELDSVASLQGGVEWYVHRLAHALMDLGHSVRVVARAPRRGQRPPDARVEHRFVKLPPLASSHRTRLLLERPFALGVRREARWADVVHGQNADGLGALGVKPLVATVHTTPLDEWGSSRLGGWRERLYQRPIQDATVRRWRRLARGAERLWTPGAHVAESLRELGARRVDVVPNPVPRLPRHDKADARRALGLPGGPLVLYLGRLAGVKRVDRVIDAVAQLTDARLVVAGEGPEEPRLRAQAAPLGDRVRFLGRVDDATKALLLSAADAFCLPSEHEGQPLALLEAMAAGVPTVATRAEWVPPELQRYGLWGDDTAALLEKALRTGRHAGAPVADYSTIARRFSDAYAEVVA